jgi:isoquinoline 1-oxidoreductase beta subunit
VKRRSFLLGAAGATGALVVGWSLLPPRQRLITSVPLALREGQSALNGWVKIGADNSVTVVMCKSEMGQGIYTGLAMLLAEELDADWAQLRIEQSPIDKIYNNLATVVDGLPFHPDDAGSIKRVAGWLTAKTMREIGVMMTGGSSSIKDLWLPMREAGASARALLIRAAAEQWKLPADECRAEAGRVLHPSGKSASFGELAAGAARQPLPQKVALKDVASFKLIGKPVRRIEGPSKLDGSAVFGIDVLLPGMLYASVELCPTLGGKLARFDGAAALQMPGVKKVVALEGYNGGTGGVAVIADAPFHAMRALKKLSVEWDHGAGASLSSEGVYRQLAETLDRETGFAYYKHGDVDAALKSAVKTIAGEYRAPYLAHAAMEPVNCTAQFKDGAATLWVSTQVPGLARSAAA